MLYNRQKLLLQVVKKLREKGIESKTYLVKTLFLLRQKFGFDIVGYDFFPYKFGPFSNEIYSDFNALKKEGLFNEATLSLTNDGLALVDGLKANEEIFSEIERITSAYSDKVLIKKFVYDNYPAFTVNSNAPRMTRDNSATGICSIGYEGKTIDCFLNKLIQNKVALLVDVRKNAFSMKKGFSKSQLEKFLGKASIGYLHVPELGIESEKRKNLESAEDYKELFKNYRSSLPGRKEKIAELKALGKKQKIALMCFEADKNFCHRGVLSDFLSQEVVHI
ncbi:MAG TPA: DUF488 family protein [archaeon]|nr:DUF488 family protein [archaeon]